MNLEEWREGIDISLCNVEQLLKDGMLLIENSSYGHACFLFITAFEESAVTYFILDRFNKPEPERLHKKEFLRHLRKFSLSRFKSFPVSGNLEFFEDFLNILRQLVSGQNHEDHESQLIELEKKVQNKVNFWDFRNNCIYTSIDQTDMKYISPLDVDQNTAINLYNSLYIIVLLLKIQRDIAFGLGIKYLKYTQDDLSILESLGNIFKLYQIMMGGDLNKLENLYNEKSSEIIKNLMIKDNIVRIEDINHFINFIFEDFSNNFKTIISKEENKKILEFILKRIERYDQNLGKSFDYSFKMIEQISEKKFDIRKYPTLLKNFQKNFKNLNFKKDNSKN